MTDINPKVFYFIRKFCDSDWQLLRERISFYDLTFILKGSAVYRSGDTEWPVKAGQAVFLPENTIRSAETEGMECAAFSFRIRTQENALPCVIDWHRDEMLMRYFSEFERSWFSLDENKEVFCKGIFLLILHRLAELLSRRQVHPRVQKIRKYLETHYTEKITVAQIAEYVGLHPTYCGALFRRETGQTILQAVNMMRINRAIEIFKYGTVKIADAAEQCGFSDVFYFSRVFKAIMGQPPESYAKKSMICEEDLTAEKSGDTIDEAFEKAEMER